MHIVPHPAIAVEVGLHILLRLGRTYADILRQRKRRNPVHDAEVDRFGPAAKQMAHLFQWDAEDLGRRHRVEVFSRKERFPHGGVAGDMRQQPQFDLAVVRIDQNLSFRSGKHRPNPGAKLLTDRNVLKVRFCRGKAAGCGHGHLEAGMDSPIRADYLQQSVGIGTLQFGERAIVQDLLDDGMLVSELFEDIDIGAPSGLGLLTRRERKLFEQDLSKLFGRQNVKVVSCQFPDLAFQFFDVGSKTVPECSQGRPVNKEACLLHL